MASEVTAYLNVEVPAKESGNVVDKLRDFPEVDFAAGVYGETDVIAKVVVSDIERLHELVMSKIQNLPHVQTTRTFIVIPSLVYERKMEK